MSPLRESAPRAVSGGPAIDGLRTAAFEIPTDEPESDGTLSWDSTTIVVTEISAGGEHGLGYTYSAAGAAGVIDSLIAPSLIGAGAFDLPALAGAAHAQVRNVGNRGIGASAVAAVEIALWDLKARLLGVALCDLLGSARASVMAYGSGGFTSYDDARLAEQLGGWADAGMSAVKMKIGRDRERDPARVRAAREAIGEIELFVDANGAYTPREAVAVAERLDADAGISWFEEPVSSDDRAGLRFVRDAAPAGIEIAAGEYAWNAYDFAALVEPGCVDVLQADATRCCGVSGFLRADAICAAHGLRLSAHTAPTVHMHACCAAPTALHLEYFHDHVRIEAMLFDGFTAAVGGRLTPDRSRPGLGVEFRWADAESFRA